MLGVETSAGFISAALSVDGVIHYKKYIEKNRQAEKLPGVIEELLQESGINIEQVDYFACTVGPGSFTGIRSGLSFMQGLSHSQEKELIGVSSLKIVCVDALEKLGYAVINAGKGRYYAQELSNDVELNEPDIIDESEFIELKDKVVILNLCPDSGGIVEPNADLLCRYISAKKIVASNEQLLPLYVRKPQAEIDLQLKNKHK